MKLLNELNIKTKIKIKLLNINKQELNFATHRQAYWTQNGCAELQ